MSAPTTTIPLGTTATRYITWAFYISVIALILFMVLLVINYTIHPVFSFMPGDGGIIPIPAKTIEQLAFSNVVAPSDLSCNIVNIVSNNYTMSVDVNISSGFYTTTIPRVLLYRSESQVTMATTDTTDAFLSRFPKTNVFMWVDPVKNDLYVSAVGVDGGGMSTLLTSKPIENVPIKDPFRITIVVTTSFIEIYMNGEMVETMPLGAYSLLNLDSTSKSNFFATPALVRQSVQVSNISYWNNILSSKIIRAQNKLRPLNKTIFNN